MDPDISLALSVHANKGVYAGLLGSGVSRDAGIPTGWEIVLDLIARIAKIRDESAECSENPEAWYRQIFADEPHYSNLLELVAKTAAERRQLLRSYFEPTDGEREEGRKVPTDAHRALAELVTAGYVRIIVTTNFDRLTEQAIEATGMTPTVISTPDSINGALPLAHSNCTIVKIHGDYLDTRILNTSTELGQYSDEVNRLLDQILDEYGLIISGWSGDWDHALRAAIERTPNRRFSTYWAYPRKLTDHAQRLVTLRGAVPVSGVTANSFFRKLAEDVKSLEELAGPQPLSARIAAQTVKRYLPEQRERIRLHDLVMEEVARVREIIADSNRLPPNGPYSGELLESRMRILESESRNLMAMFAVAGYWADEANRELWRSALGRLSTFALPPGQSIIPYDSLRRYPALLAAYAAGVGAMAAGRTETVADLMIRTEVPSSNDDSPESFVVAVNPSTVLENRFQSHLPGREKQLTPLSARIWNDSGLYDALREYFPDFNAFTEAFDRFEYLAGLIGCDLHEWAPVGCFVWRRGLFGDVKYMTVCNQLNAEIESEGENLALLKSGAFDSSLERLKSVKSAYESGFRNWFR